MSEFPIEFSLDEETEFEKEALNHHTAEKVPYSFWDRYRMVSSIWPSEIASGKIIILPLPRPQGPIKWWQYVLEFLPSKRFWIIPQNGDPFDDKKELFLSSVGEKVVRLTGLPRITSGSHLRKLIRENEQIDELIPGEILKIIKEKDSEG